ncbi:MAG: SMI1/KNR4 family protein [Verrucomicrobiales bacterium]|nr:SMI1/KNR4 family protein [bacterium]MDF2376169.1 SMI1/KNR4 family protein [Verrucomicrobiales bacterium]
MSQFLWKAHIISLTEQQAARERKCDASFFPPVPEEKLLAWENEKDVSLPDEIRSYLLQSDGLEAQRGEIWPVLPLPQWEVIRDDCLAPHPWIRFGETLDFVYLLSLGHSPSIYRHAKSRSDEEFFAPGFRKYLEQIFRGYG